MEEEIELSPSAPLLFQSKGNLADIHGQKKDKKENGSSTTIAYKKTSRNTLLLWDSSGFAKNMAIRLRPWGAIGGRILHFQVLAGHWGKLVSDLNDVISTFRVYMLVFLTEELLDKTVIYLWNLGTFSEEFNIKCSKQFCTFAKVFMYLTEQSCSTNLPTPLSRVSFLIKLSQFCLGKS